MSSTLLNDRALLVQSLLHEQDPPMLHLSYHRSSSSPYSSSQQHKLYSPSESSSRSDTSTSPCSVSSSVRSEACSSMSSSMSSSTQSCISSATSTSSSCSYRETTPEHSPMLTKPARSSSLFSTSSTRDVCKQMSTFSKTGMGLETWAGTTKMSYAYLPPSPGPPPDCPLPALPSPHSSSAARATERDVIRETKRHALLTPPSSSKPYAVLPCGASPTVPRAYLLPKQWEEPCAHVMRRRRGESGGKSVHPSSPLSTLLPFCAVAGLVYNALEISGRAFHSEQNLDKQGGLLDEKAMSEAMEVMDENNVPEEEEEEEEEETDDEEDLEVQEITALPFPPLRSSMPVVAACG